MREGTREQVRRTHAALESAGLVLGHRVLVYRIGEAQAHRGKVVALDPVMIKLDRVKWSDAFRVGDRVRALHTGRHAVEATIVGAACGTLRLSLGRMTAEEEAR